MKKIILTFFVLTVFVKAQGQVFVDGVDINEKSIKYIIVSYYGPVATPLAGRSQPVIHVDYGQNFKGPKERIVTDDKGNQFQFNSEADILNYFDKNGWVLISTVSLSQTSGLRFVFQRKDTIPLH